MHRERADLVGVGLPRLAIDPAEQRVEPGLVVRIGEEVDEQRDAAARLVQVPVDRVADVAVVAPERRDRVADVRRVDVLPVQVRGVAPDGEIELRRQRLPQRGEAVVEALNQPDLGAAAAASARRASRSAA